MKKYISIILILVLSGLGVYAQPKGDHNDRKDRIESLKIAFITQKLNLTPEEAKVFWPVYNKYQEEKMNIWKNLKAKYKLDEDELATLSDKEVEQALNDFVAFRQAEVDLLKKYTAEFKKVIPVRKVALLYKAEVDFRKELIKQLKKGRGGDK